MILQLFCILVLSSPLFYGLWDDRNGDKHPNKDIELLTLMGLIASVVVALINPLQSFFIDMLKAAGLSIGIFISIFPYAINIVHYRNKVISDPKWWDHLSETATPDKWPIWKNTHWVFRMWFLAIILGLSICIYFIYTPS